MFSDDLVAKMLTRFITPEITFGDLFEVALSIAEVGDKPMGIAFIGAYARMLQNVNPGVKSEIEAMTIVKENLGYLCGYYDEATRKLIFDFYETVHPFFGYDTPTPEEALEKGKEWARGNL
jgi:hypothetical protein